MKEKIIVYVEGGNVQGIQSTLGKRDIEVFMFDQDNLDEMNEEEVKEVKRELREFKKGEKFKGIY